MGGGFLAQAFVYLAAAVVAVPVAKRLGLGSVLGYLLAGAAIGPYALGWVGQEGADVMHFAEFGVVMMLFVVGLELEPSTLWRLRLPVLGLGGLQVAVTSIALGGLGMALGLGWKAALAVGMTLSLSSTAIALQTLSEKGLLRSVAGQSSFAVLLFQDIAVIPMLALFPLLGAEALAAGGGGAADHASDTWTAGWPAWAEALAVLLSVAGIVALGRFALGPAFRAIARTGLRELFTAAALLLVVGIAMLMEKVGLSPALGTFVAGVVLASSEYRHELESDVEPFKGLLLGLFFIAVGASINFALVAAMPGPVAGLVLGVLALKTAVLAALGRAFRLTLDQTLIFGAALAQVGEFAFVLLSFGAGHGVFDAEQAALLAAVVALSMAITPLLFVVVERVLLPRTIRAAGPAREHDTGHHESAVIVAGYGRFGQVASRLLRAAGFETTVLDADPDQVETLRKLGHRVYFGDATRVDLLASAGAAKAKLLIIAIDNADKALELAHTARKHFPHLVLLARARGRTEAYDLLGAGVHHVHRELFGGSLRLGIDALRALGVRAHRAHRVVQVFAERDEQNVVAFAKERPTSDDWLSAARRATEELERTLARDLSTAQLTRDDAWDADSLREDVRSKTFVVQRPDDER